MKEGVLFDSNYINLEHDMYVQELENHELEASEMSIVPSKAPHEILRDAMFKEFQIIKE